MKIYKTKSEESRFSRRHFIKTSVRLFTGMGLVFSSINAFMRNVWANTKRTILPKGTKMDSLVNQNPAALDTRNLEVIPLNDFETMGLTDHKVELKTWRFEIDGEVAKPRTLTYSQLLALPSIEREVLLICPGFFSIYGRWKGVSVMELLKLAKADDNITHISLRGPNSRYEKVEQFPVEDIVSNKVFLAYQVNGQNLPQKHGFPLRAVAEDYYGSQWVKYVYKMEVHNIPK